MEISSPEKLKNPGSRTEALVKAIADKAELAARLRSVLSDRTVAELQALKAENRIVGIKAQLDFDLKIRVAKEIGIDRDHLVIGASPLFPGLPEGGLTGSEGRGVRRATAERRGEYCRDETEAGRERRADAILSKTQLEDTA